MIKELNNKSLIYGIPGLLIQSVFLFIDPLISLLGTALLIIGLSYYSRAKGHSGYFGFLGLLSWLGIIVLILLKDKHITAEEQTARRTTKTTDVIWGILLGLGLLIGVPLILFVLSKLFAS